MTQPAGDGAEGGATDADTGAEGNVEVGGIVGPEAQNWWQFADKDAAEAWGNKLVTTRLTRERKNKLDPIVTERDTLRAEVDRLKPLEDATKSDIQRRDDALAARDTQIAELLQFKQSRERQDLVRGLAEEAGLPSKFVSRVTGDDEDAIREDIADLLNVLSEGGSTSKKTPTPKAPKSSGTPNGRRVSSGGGGSDDDESDDALAASILESIRKDRGRGGLTTRR